MLPSLLRCSKICVYTESQKLNLDEEGKLVVRGTRMKAVCKKFKLHGGEHRWCKGRPHFERIVS